MENRIVIYAPTGKDARLIAQVLSRAEIDSHACTSTAALLAALHEGVGALLLVDEVLTAPLLAAFTRFLDEQPAWSDLPVLVMSQRQRESLELQQAYAQLGNVTLLERPVHGLTLVSAVKSALRARSRQYAMREVDQRKDEFLAMLAHELRNPLAPVSAASELLKIPGLSREKIWQTSNIISRQVNHLAGLVDDLLDLSRVSRGLVTLETALLDARHILTVAVEQVRPVIDRRRHRLTLRTSPEQAYIKGDQKRLVQILSNVLNNAAKYTAEGGDIVLSMDVTAAEVVFTVSDNGIGMSENVMDHIFEMFSQAARTSDRSEGGLGIGLALVKNLVHLHGGRVAAHSTGLGNGSRFDITLPRSLQIQEGNPTTVVTPEKRSADFKVLIVDDNVDAASMLGMYLELAGYQVMTVHTAGAALAFASKAKQLDACLLDIGLPDMDGTELAKRLKKLSATASATMIAITGYGQEADRQKTLAAGFDSHYVKPVNIEKLVGALTALH